MNPNEEPFGKLALQYLVEAFRVIVLSLAIILPVRYFLIQPFYVRGASMEPNFHDHEYLVIDEISYRFSEPKRGDTVVFRPPGQSREHFIKRVIGLPGETVLVRNGLVFLIDAEHPEGFPLDESTYLPGIVTPGETRVTLGADEYFLLGDNRPLSLDSRSFGPVEESLIVGRVWIRGWPLEKLGRISSPNYAQP